MTTNSMRPAPSRARIAELFFFLDMGGVERCIVNLMNALSPAEFDRQVIVTHHGGMMESHLSSGITFTRLPEQNRMLHLIRLLENIDIAHINTTNMNPFFTWAAAMADVPVILETVHASVDNPYVSYLDHTVCVSRFVQSLQSRPQKSGVIYNGIPVHREAAGAPPPLRDTVVIAEMRRPDKELELSLVDLFDALECEKNNMECWILGVEGESRAGLKFFGKVPDPLTHLAQADFMFHFPAHEAISAALIEGMSCGLIPITNGVGGIPEIVHDGINGICREIKESRDAVDLVKGLVLEYRGGSERLLSLRRNGLKTVKERFDITQTHSSYRGLFLDLAKTNREKGHRSLRDLLMPGGAEDHSGFLSMIEGYCFDPETGIKRIQACDPKAVTPKQRAFLLAIAGRELLLHHRHEDAYPLLAEALGLWEDDFYVHLFMGETARETGFLNRARTAFQRAHSMDETNMLAVFGHLQSLLEIRDFGSAKRLCERMISALPPGNPGKRHIEQVYQKISPLSLS